jgi:hypothetical protein
MQRVFRGLLKGLIVCLALFGGGFFQPTLAATPEPQTPPGFQLLDSALGVQLYSKEYPNGNPDYVQVIDMSQGASLKLLHGQITQPRPGLGVYGGADPRMLSPTLQDYWNQAKAESENAFCVTNGSFFYMPEYPTRLPFPLKVDGQMVTEGWGIHTYIGEHMMLEIWGDRADIRDQNRETLYSSTAPDIVGALSENANKRAKYAVGRTFVGVEDRDLDGAFETVLVYNTSSATQVQAAAMLRSFGADKIMMLDGGGSTQLLCRSGYYINSERPVPQAIAVVAASPPPVASELVNFPDWPVLLEGENFPLKIEIENTGRINWAPGETILVVEKSALGSQVSLDFQTVIEPGETAVVSDTLAAYTTAGVYTVRFNWGLSYEGKSYPGEAFEVHTIVIPPDLAEKQPELAALVRGWLPEGSQVVEERVKGWIQAQSQQQLLRIPVPEQVDIRLSDVFWIPVIMLPVMLVLALLVGRMNRGA